MRFRSVDSMSTKLTKEQRAEILRLHQNGVSNSDISKQLNIPGYKVSNIIHYWQDPEVQQQRRRGYYYRRDRQQHKEQQPTEQPKPKVEHKQRTVSEMLDEGKPEHHAALHNQVYIESVKRIAVSKKTKLRADEVPTTWAGAFKALASFALRHGYDDAYEYAEQLALAKNVRL